MQRFLFSVSLVLFREWVKDVEVGKIKDLKKSHHTYADLSTVLSQILWEIDKIYNIIIKYLGETNEILLN